MILLVIYLVLQALDGRAVLVNPEHVVSMSEPRENIDPDDKLLTDKAHCVLLLTNGTKVSVAETCDSIRSRLEEAKR